LVKSLPPLSCPQGKFLIRISGLLPAAHTSVLHDIVEPSLNLTLLVSAACTNNYLLILEIY
jgi:hypothetical protein